MVSNKCDALSVGEVLKASWRGTDVAVKRLWWDHFLDGNLCTSITTNSNNSNASDNNDDGGGANDT